jgi:Ca2+/Na+ antiporter
MQFLRQIILSMEFNRGGHDVGIHETLFWLYLFFGFTLIVLLIVVLIFKLIQFIQIKKIQKSTLNLLFFIVTYFLPIGLTIILPFNYCMYLYFTLSMVLYYFIPKFRDNEEGSIDCHNNETEY